MYIRMKGSGVRQAPAQTLSLHKYFTLLMARRQLSVICWDGKMVQRDKRETTTQDFSFLPRPGPRALDEKAKDLELSPDLLFPSSVSIASYFIL